MTERERLPNRRGNETFEIVGHNGQRGIYQVTLSRYPNGRVGEVFISSNRIGSQQDALARDLAILCSIALQYGAEPEVIAHAITRESNGSPSTIIGAVFDRILKNGEQGDKLE